MPKTWAILLATLALIGCARKAPVLHTPGAPTYANRAAFVTAAAEVALPQFVASERDAAIRGDRAASWRSCGRRIRASWTATVRRTADDFIWAGRAAILDRYDLAVFPSPPPAFATPPAFRPQVAGDIAAASLGNDAWRFQWDGQRWWLLELRY